MTKTIATLGLAATLLAGGAMAQSQEMTLDQVDPSDPFGEIAVTRTMLDPRTIEAWAGGLDEESRAELQSRCEFMLANELRYDIADRSFCRTLLGT